MILFPQIKQFGNKHIFVTPKQKVKLQAVSLIFSCLNYAENDCILANYIKYCGFCTKNKILMDVSFK